MEKYLDRIIRILYRLLRDETDITFCLENGCAIYELPDLSSFGYILEDLKSCRIAYWHNAGNAHFQENLDLVDRGAWLGEFGQYASGAYLHDAVGLDSGFPPGAGEIDFKQIRSELPADALPVIRLNPSCSPDDFNLGIGELQRQGF